MNQIKKYCFLFLLLISFTNCFNDNQNQNNKLPYKFVQFDVNLSLYSAELGFPGGFVVFQQYGHRGVLVYNVDGNNFLAYDLACPQLNLEECSAPMRADASTLPSVVCDCDDEEVVFNILNPIKEINGEVYAMQQYFAVLGGGVIRITN